MKFLLLVVVLFLAFQGGAWRTRRLVSTVKRLPKDFADGRDRAEHPVDHAKDVTPTSSSSTKSPNDAR